MYLHSTMYLLKLIVNGLIILYNNIFTFHYVSIKTKPVEEFFNIDFEFTFHYVSIKTITARMMQIVEINLHSTMYLLKPWVFLICLS